MDQKEFNNVIRAFKTAHREKEKIHISGNRQMDVMNLVRYKRKSDFRGSFFNLFQQLVWKLVPLTCVLALALGIVLNRIDFFSDYEMVKFFINNPSDMSMLSIYDR